MKKKFKRKHSKSIYRSGLEDSVVKQLDSFCRSKSINYEYEPKDKKISYTIPSSTHTYLPDFYITTKSGKQIIIETKGIWSYDDRYKHLLIRQQWPELDIRFVFTRSKSPIIKGSKTTYRDICGGLGRGPFRGVTWKYSDKLIPKEWLHE